MNTSPHFHRHSPTIPHLHHVPAWRPLLWLQHGWEDMTTHPTASLAYGALISMLGIVVLGYYSLHPFIIAIGMTGFMLIAPIMAAGLADLSRQHSQQGRASFEHSLDTLHLLKKPLIRYAAILSSLSAIWFAISAYVLYETFGSVGPSLGKVLMGNVFDTISATQMFAYIAIGVILASIVFVMSIVTVPMIIDRKSDVKTAIGTSVSAALNADRGAMTVWGMLCLLLVSLGFATYLIGMVVIFPLLGHATWYAYEDLVDKKTEDK